MMGFYYELVNTFEIGYLPILAIYWYVGWVWGDHISKNAGKPKEQPEETPVIKMFHNGEFIGYCKEITLNDLENN